MGLPLLVRWPQWTVAGTRGPSVNTWMNEAQRHAALKVTQQVSEGGGVKPGPRLQQTANPKECSTQFWAPGPLTALAPGWMGDSDGWMDRRLDGQSGRVTVRSSEWRRSCVCMCWHPGSVDNGWAETDERAAYLVSQWKARELPTPGSGRRSRHTPMCECSCNTRWKESCTGDYDTAVRTKKLTPHVSMEEQPQHGRRRERVQGMSLEAGRPRRRLAQRRGDRPCSPRILDQGFEA
nr:uncharacterized protein LOC129471327 isoform X3 [Symphalangus syndactylus]